MQDIILHIEYIYIIIQKSIDFVKVGWGGDRVHMYMH